jgi:hypothetical protein
VRLICLPSCGFVGAVVYSHGLLPGIRWEVTVGAQVRQPRREVVVIPDGSSSSQFANYSLDDHHMLRIPATRLR